MTDPFIEVLTHIKETGKHVGPRGLQTLEALDVTYRLAPYDRFMTFPSRKLSLQYIRDELQWYLKGDRTDLSITEKAKIWKTAVTNGQLNSNYGWYLFSQGGLQYAVATLLRDASSRRAVVPILGAEHLHIDSNDVPCTVSLGLRIRDNELQCTVHMRSQDAIFGMGNDIPFFSFYQEMALVLLRAQKHRDLVLGPLVVFVESLHVYERHWPMLTEILGNDSFPPEARVEVHCPRLSGEIEVMCLLEGRYDTAAGAFPFSKWLFTRE